jgi:hypothetical protein
MPEVLSQDEIDQLLSAIDSAEAMPQKLMGTIRGFVKKGFAFKEFQKFLTSRKFEPEEPYGIFDKDVSVCRFFDGKDNNHLLKKIRAKNQKQGMGKIVIPNTQIELLNYSVCPKWGDVFSFQDLMEYYKAPVSDDRFSNKIEQFRKDTRVCCSKCKTFFLPALLVIDGTPKNETQFLCRIQIIDAIEAYLSKKQILVLTKNRANLLYSKELVALKNDVFLKDLEEKPTLITNLLQYTPPNLMGNLIDGSNVENGDTVFGQWFKKYQLGHGEV